MLKPLHALLVLASIAGAAPARAQGVPPASDLAQLRTLLDEERNRVAQLEAELAARHAAIDALAARLDALAAPAAAPSPHATAQAEPKPPAAPRFDFYADTLVRLATLHQGYDGCVGCPDRTIGRFRLRFGAEGKLAPAVRAVFGLSAGELNDPNSVYQTLGGNLSRKVATFDRAYIAYTPQRGRLSAELMAGKFPYSWLRSSMTFDVDFYPEGATERVALSTSRTGVLRAVSAQAVQVVVNEQPAARDMLLIGGQATATLQPAPRVATRVAATLFDVRRPELILRSQFDGTDVGVRNTNAVATDGGALHYASDFRYANVIVENAVRTPWPAMPLTASLELHRNLRAVSSRDAAASIRFDAGRLQKRGDVGLSWHVFNVEQDAIVSALGESDWRAPSNVRQHRFAFTWVAQEHVRTLFTWYRGRTLDTSLPSAVIIPGLVPGRPEPWANRLYFDILYTY